MNEVASPTVLIVPGLRDHMPEHWQTFLESELANARCVPRMDGDKHKLSCAAWVAKLDDSLAQIEGPVILAAHSAGCMIVSSSRGLPASENRSCTSTSRNRPPASVS